MDYLFGINGEKEVLKIKGSAHTDLTGFQQTVREYPDCIIADIFRVVRKMKSEKDVAGNCYDWYEIDRHNRTIDKTPPLKQQAEDIDVMLVDQEYRLAMLELGLTENGG